MSTSPSPRGPVDRRPLDQRLRLAVAPALGLVCLGLSQCAPELPSPISPVEVAEHDSARALVHYLAQRGASPAVCGRDPAGLRITLSALDGSGADRLVRGLTDGRVDPLVWQLCATLLLGRADDLRGPRLSASVLKALAAGPWGPPASAPQRFAALLSVYRDRPPRWVTDARLKGKVAAKLAKRLRSKTAQAREPEAREPGAAELVRSALAVLGAESGTWEGRPISGALLDELHRRLNVEALQLLARRAPRAEWRKEAERRIIRIAILASRHRELRDMTVAVEEAVLRDGHFAVGLDRFPVQRSWLDQAALGGHGFLLVQDVLNQMVQVFHNRQSLHPKIPLRGKLWLTLQGFSRPITLCPPGRGLDPTPCVPAMALSVVHPRVTLDADGVLTLGRWPMAQAIQLLGRSDSLLEIPLRARGGIVATLVRPARWRAPSALWFLGQAPGGSGPSLRIQVEHRGGRIFYRLTGASRALLAVTEAQDAGRFPIATQGARGSPGADGVSGSAGSRGHDGQDASCPSSSGTDGSRGEDGGPGGPGGPGGQGGAGGDVEVLVLCSGGACSTLAGALRASISSFGGEGGPGGRGGWGGSGGSGGRGGFSKTCYDSNGNSSSLSGGSSGSSGSNGPSGPDGSPGDPGPPGTVRIRLEAAQ